MRIKFYGIILVLFLLYSVKAKAQKYNRAYADKHIAGAYAVVSTQDKGAIAVSAVQPNFLNGSAFKTNAAGDTVWLKIIDVAKGKTTVGEDAFTISRLGKSRYIVGGDAGDSVTHNSQAYLLWLNNNGDTLRLRKYGTDTNSERCYGIKERKNGNIVFAGFRFKKGKTAFSVGDCDVYIVGTDSNGTQLWEHQYGGPNDDFIQSIDNTTDGGYVLGGQTFVSGVPKVYLIKTDSLGNLKWQKTYDYGFGSGAQAVITTLDGGYLLVGACNFNAAHNSAGYLVKTDSAGKVQWQQQYKGVSQDAYFGGVKQLPTGEFVVCGGQTQDVLNSRYYGWLLKLDSANGSVKWQKTYSYYPQDSTQHYFYGMDTTAGRGFVMCGMALDYHAHAPHGNQVWLVKTDSLGCDSVNCIRVGIKEVKVSKIEEINIWPNPVTNGVLHIESTEKYNEVTLYNLLGEKVLEVPSPPSGDLGGLSRLSKGVYFIKLRSTSEERTCKVIIQ